MNDSINKKHPLVWMDLEMSGLDPEKEFILEMATLITDNELNIIAQGPHLIVHQSDSVLEQMDSWNKHHHKVSGLIEKVKASRLSQKDAQEQTLIFLRERCQKEKSPLCGNSIGQDRRFLKKHMPELEDFFHYRNIDISSIKELVARWYPSQFNPPKKKGSHQALEDIKESILELAYYRKYFFKSI